MMLTMQETISNLTAQLEALKKPLEKDEEIQIMHHKDIEKQMKTLKCFMYKIQNVKTYNSHECNNLKA